MTKACQRQRSNVPLQTVPNPKPRPQKQLCVACDWLRALPTPSLCTSPSLSSPSTLSQTFKVILEETHSRPWHKHPWWESACSTSTTCPTTPSRCWSRSPWRPRSTRTASTASSEWEPLCWPLTAVCTQVTSTSTLMHVFLFSGGEICF